MISRTSAVLLLFSISLLVGCQRQSGLDKVVVSGNVTYDGEPIEYGIILFRPVAGTKGPSSSTQIFKGRYKMAAKGGIPLGRHQVVIKAFSGQMGDANDPGLTDLPSGPQFLPEKYNRDSTLEFEAVASPRELQQDFLLSSS